MLVFRNLFFFVVVVVTVVVNVWCMHDCAALEYDFLVHCLNVLFSWHDFLEKCPASLFACALICYQVTSSVPGGSDIKGSTITECVRHPTRCVCGALVVWQPGGREYKFKVVVIDPYVGC